MSTVPPARPRTRRPHLRPGLTHLGYPVPPVPGWGGATPSPSRLRWREPGRRVAGLLLALALPLLLACGGEAAPESSEPEPTPTPEVDEAYRTEIEQWRSERLERLKRPDGWLTLTGLEWLEEGRQTIGSAADSDIRLPDNAPGKVGVLDKQDASVMLILEPGVEVSVSPEEAGAAIASTPAEGKRALLLASDAEGEPTLIEVGDVSFYLIQRGERDRLGVRIRNAASPARETLEGLEYFPLEGAWSKTARFERYEPPREIPIVDVLGMVTPSPVPGALVFEHDGETYRLDALDADDELFVIFADQTNGHGTYKAGRYLYAAKPAPGETTTRLDFNRAYNPPCAFTAFATCPLPPPQNRLPIEVKAGERYAGDGSHD